RTGWPGVTYPRWCAMGLSCNGPYVGNCTSTVLGAALVSALWQRPPASTCVSRTNATIRRCKRPVNYEDNLGWRILQEDVICSFGFVNHLERAVGYLERIS